MTFKASRQWRWQKRFLSNLGGGICPECGAKFVASRRVCPECGVRFGEKKKRAQSENKD